MGRWEPHAPNRLHQAALELFAERGYDATTVAAIAERAGLTERTFYRHYADKREVLFDGGEALQEAVVEGVAAAPADASAFAAVVAGLEATGAMLAERRAFSSERQRVIAAHPELQERELAKMAAWSVAIAATLRARGVEPAAASVAAEAGMAVFRIAFERWTSDDGPEDLALAVRDAAAEMRAATA